MSYLRTLAVSVVSGPQVRWIFHAVFTFHTSEGSGFRIHGLECAHKT